ncbi:YtxH domain-containing protein [Campylobacter sp. RM12327]|uniref:hypothetical protein n=1 Tax=Campylobacter sputorum TaxID=206 RepID=UPI000B772D69|nr:MULTISPECIES: hypothetical protein [Campylobacter]ASM40787.1 hypothetical protein CSPB_1622 [Campylobacter sputorum]MBE7357905.1 YtxH domain-containing protein [Campylobacter sp. RM11302]MBF6669668.1 YtxH domain-containing protein [Campylobacter sp. RM12327]MBF6674811.1 YtxH domain-containing protein [Campylobacter sp. RM13538]MBF6675751.1 YtxH domain-containing protein [Campylobacter sp. RM12321]
MINPYIQKTQTKIEEKIVNSQNELKNNTQENINQTNAQNSGILGSILPGNFNSASFFQGAIIGALGAYLLTNEKAQQALFKSAVKIGKFIQAGSEELKERFEDAKAEIEAENQL